MQAPGEDGLLVGLTVAVGVLEDDDLVVRLRVARTPGRVARHRRHPETSTVVESDSHGLGEVGELLL